MKLAILLAAVVGCGGKRGPDVTQHVPAVAASEVLAVTSAPGAAPPLVVIVDDAGKLAIGAAETWSELATFDASSAKPIDVDQLDKLMRQAEALGWKPQEVRDHAGKPLAAAASSDDPLRADNDTSGGAGTAMKLDEGMWGKHRLPRVQRVNAAGGFGNLGFSRAPHDYPERQASIVGEVVDDHRLKPVQSALVLASPHAKATAMIAAIGATRGAIAVAHAGKLAALRLQFLRDPMVDDRLPPWLELRVSAGKLELEDVPDAPIALPAKPDTATLKAALATAFARRGLDPMAAIDVLVSPDLDAQGLVDLLVVLDLAGARAIGLGSMPVGPELGLRGHRIRHTTIGLLALDGNLDQQSVRRLLAAEPAVVACYTTALATKPELAGHVDAKFAIDAKGATRAIEVYGVDDDLDRCVAAHVKQLGFARGPATVTVQYFLNPDYLQ